LEHPVKAGTRRLVGSVGAVAFMFVWIWAALAIGDRLPDVMWLKLIYFAVAGTAWGVPLFPLIAWANRPD